MGIIDFFNSLTILHKVFFIACLTLLLLLLILICFLFYRARKRKKEKKVEQNEKLSVIIQPIAEETQPITEGTQAITEETPVVTHGYETLDGVTSEPVFPQADKWDKGQKEHESESEIGYEQKKEYERKSEIDDFEPSFCDSDSQIDYDESAYDAQNNNGDVVKGVDDVFAFAKNRQREFVSFFSKLERAEKRVKENYYEITKHALSYDKIKLRKSANSEKGYVGSNLLFTLKIHGKSLRIYYALNMSDYVGTTIPLSDESGKKSYNKTPVMLKITGALSVKRAKILIDDVAKRFNCEKKKEKI